MRESELSFRDKEVELWLDADGGAVLFGRVVHQAGRSLLLAPAAESSPSAPMQPGQTVFLRAVLEDGVCVAPARLAGFGFSGRLRLELVGTLERVQRRRYERVPMDRRPCAVIALDEARQPTQRGEGLMIDLSAGGAQLESGIPCAPGDLLLLSVGLGEGPPIGVALSVVAVDWNGDAAPQGSERRYRVRGSFAFIKPEDRQRVFRYVLERRRGPTAVGEGANAGAAA